MSEGQGKSSHDCATKTYATRLVTDKYFITRVIRTWLTDINSLLFTRMSIRHYLQPCVLKTTTSVASKVACVSVYKLSNSTSLLLLSKHQLGTVSSSIKRKNEGNSVLRVSIFRRRRRSRS